MAGLIREVLIKALLAMVISGTTVFAFDSLRTFGENIVQTVGVFAFYIYCILVLLFPSRENLFHILSIPVLTQFLHLFQKYTFPAGANSIWRLLPFLLIDLYLVHFLLKHKPALNGLEKLLVLSWIVLNLLFLVISPNLGSIIAGGFTFFLITLPLYFLYLKVISRIPGFHAELEKCLCFIFVILALGTFALVFAGARYKNSDNLLVTRNISDTNVTMAYFILMWPFTLLYARHSRNQLIWISITTLLFTGVVVISFSRGAVFIVAPYLLGTLIIISGFKQLAWLILIGCLPVAYTAEIISSINADLAYSWQLRFADLQFFTPHLKNLQEVSGRGEIQSTAYVLFTASPLYGHGIGSFEVLGPGYREAHSMFYTLLAEQGLAGAIFMYSLFTALAYRLLRLAAMNSEYVLLFLGLLAYLVFVHSVGTVFVIIPAKSITINCIAPILLLSIYFYADGSRHILQHDGT